MLRVVPEKSYVGTEKGSVVIECETNDVHQAHEHLQSIKAKKMALDYAAQKGLVPPSINGNVQGPYPVNEEGQDYAEAFEKYGLDVNKNFKISKYRITVPVCRSLITL
jgi:hypothetical protein